MPCPSTPEPTLTRSPWRRHFQSGRSAPRTAVRHLLHLFICLAGHRSSFPFLRTHLVGRGRKLPYSPQPAAHFGIIDQRGDPSSCVRSSTGVSQPGLNRSVAPGFCQTRHCYWFIPLSQGKLHAWQSTALQEGRSCPGADHSDDCARHGTDEGASESAPESCL